MKVVQTVVGIIHDGEYFLLLKKQATWVGWQFVQGGQDKGETKEGAVLREIKEEAGLNGIMEQRLRFKRDYWYWEKGPGKKKENVHKEQTFFLVKASKKDKIILCKEHNDYGWYTKDEALGLLRYNKDVFREVLKRYFNEGLL